MKNKHAGSSFESFLQEEGIAEAVDAAAVKRAFVVQLEQRMKKVRRTSPPSARRWEAPRLWLGSSARILAPRLRRS